MIFLMILVLLLIFGIFYDNSRVNRNVNTGYFWLLYILIIIVVIGLFTYGL